MTSLFDLDENSSDSEDDVDYVPEGNVSDVSVSDGDVSNDEEILQGQKTKRKGKLKNSSTEPEEKSGKTITPATKEKANEIWKSFLEEVEQIPQQENGQVTGTSPSVSAVTENSANLENISKSDVVDSPKGKLNDILEFAGETIAVSKDRSGINNLSSEVTDSSVGTNSKKLDDALPVKRKGLQSVMGTIFNKKQKINTLQKSLMDWKSYKKDEGIEEDLQTFNRGKGGFIERQRFLERSNVRSYEVERDIRMSKCKK